MRVLVVDDDADIAELIAKIIRHLGHTATACADPTEALSMHLDADFDVIMCDYQMMPNGVTILTAFESSMPWAFRVLITGSSMTRGIRDAEQAGIVHRTLFKPATIQDLKSAIDDAAR